MKTDNRNAITGKVICAAVITAVCACFLSACGQSSIAEEVCFVPDSQAEYIGQDQEAVGYYKRVSAAKEGETFEEMKASLDAVKKGWLVLKDDGTAYFELDGETTAYTFDKQNFYLRDDTEKTGGFPYTYINGRLILNDGETVTQYLRLTDEELASYLRRKESSETEE